MDLSKVFSFQKNSPATENEINFSENNILGDLPEVYKQFLRETNGMVLNLCVLYDTDSIVEMYKVNEFAKYAPNYLSMIFKWTKSFNLNFNDLLIFILLDKFFRYFSHHFLLLRSD